MSKRVLVIDDHEDNREIVRILLKNTEFQVLEACDGESALETAAQERPDLILMDLQLPGISGYDVMRRIKADPQWRAIPIIALTSFALSGDDGKAAVGCNGKAATTKGCR